MLIGRHEDLKATGHNQSLEEDELLQCYTESRHEPHITFVQYGVLEYIKFKRR